jgi:hypothetical protein
MCNPGSRRASVPLFKGMRSRAREVEERRSIFVEIHADSELHDLSPSSRSKLIEGYRMLFCIVFDVLWTQVFYVVVGGCKAF